MAERIPITDVIESEQPKLRAFLRRHLPDSRDVEDVLQDVFYELVVAYDLAKPIEHLGAWMFRVARNRIIDRFRKSRPTEPDFALEDVLPSPEDGPEAQLRRTRVLEAIDRALAELPAEQRQAFLANEIDGISFKDMSASTGVPLNTLLARKRYAVLHHRKRLQEQGEL
jgi:RNA polymerase sigma factor (sigma-70 family)